jgi:hypothetical protein
MRTRNQTTASNPAPAISVLFCIIVVALILSSKDAQDDLVGKQANYCELRQIHIDSGGEYGWPVLPGYGECK